MKLSCKNIVDGSRLLAVGAVVFGASTLFAQISYEPLRSPEREFAEAMERLEIIQERLRSSKQVFSKPGLAAQNLSMRQSFQDGQNYFAAGEYLACVQSLNRYLNDLQVADHKKYSKAQLLLGHSYSALGYASRAVRAYRRYLSTFLTLEERSYNELIDVLRSMMPLVAEVSDRVRDSQLEALLAAVVNLDLPSERAAETHFYAALAATQIQRLDLAEEWLTRARSLAGDEHLEARALFSEATLRLNSSDYANADELLSKIIALQGDSAKPMRSLARLALARLSVHRRQLEKALKYYRSVDAGTPEFRDSLFERIYVLTELGKTKEAFQRSQEFLTKYQDHEDAFAIRVLQSYLKLHAGRLVEADGELTQANSKLAALAASLRVRFGLKQQLEWSDVVAFKEMTRQELAPSPVLLAGEKVFKQVAVMKERLAAIRGDIRNQVYGLSRMAVSHARPSSTRRLEQLRADVYEIFEVGDRLIRSETALYKDRFSGADLVLLQGLLKRRTKRLTPLAKAKQQRGSWALASYLMKMNQRLAKVVSKLQNSSADLAAASYLVEAKKLKSKPGAKLVVLKSRLKRTQELFLRTADIMRREQIASLKRQLPVRSLRRFVIRNTGDMYDESTVVARYRDSTTGLIDQRLGRDGEIAWKRWQQSIQMVFSQIRELESSSEAWVDTRLRTLDKLHAKERALSKDLDRIEGVLKLQMGESIGELLAHYTNYISERLSRNKKWQADIRWLQYRDVKKERSVTSRTFEEERQKIRNRIEDLKDGDTDP